METTLPSSLSEVESIIDSHFEDIVGQKRAKEQIKRLLMSAYAQGGYLKPIFIAASVGHGKTKILRKIHELVKLILGRKRILFEGGKEMGSVSSFFEEYGIPHIHNCESVLFADEFHEAASEIQILIRDMLEPTVTRGIKVVKRAAGEIVYNPIKNSIVIATNRIDKIDSALKSRFELVQLQDYSDDELAEILFRALKKEHIQFNENSILKIAQCNRGSARNIVDWYDAITGYVAILGKKTVNKADIAEIIRQQGVFPMGVNEGELRTLLLLEEHGPLQRKELADKQCISAKEQEEYEKYLRMRHFLTTDSKRILTKQGREYLASLREDKFIPERETKDSVVQD